MSFVVARMQKMKSGNLVGVGNHNQRNTDNHSNKDIDVERSYLNYDLVNRTENYKRDIEQFINDNKSSSRAVRKDAVLINEWIITSDNQFFKDKDDKEIKDFFEQSKDYFAEKFGDENIRYAQVHLDETTPHMHLGIVPFNAETDLPKEITKVKGKYSELVKEYNDLVRKSNRNIETLEELEKENKSLKNEIKDIYKGFKAYFKDSKQVTTEQVKTLVGGVVDKVKEFVKGGEFEKIHRNETRTRDRDELSR